MQQNLYLFIVLFLLLNNISYAYNTDNAIKFWQHYGKQQIKSKDSKGNTIYLTPNYNSYAERNEVASEKIVVIYDKYAPEGAYGCQYVLYTPIGKYVGHHRIMQPSLNGYGIKQCVWDGGEYSKTPQFQTILEAKHYYYPQWY